MAIRNQNILSELVTSIDLERGNIFYNGNIFCFNLIRTLSFFPKKSKYFNSVALIVHILSNCIV